MSIMSKSTAAYLAGYIDGDGYLGIMAERKYKNMDRIVYSPVIKIVSVDKEIIDWLKDSFGGWTYKRVFKDSNCKDAYSWTLAGKRIEPFIRKVKPYLKLKGRQAEILLKRMKHYDKRGKGVKTCSGSNFKYSKEILEEQELLYIQIRKLNKRGKN